MLEKIEVDADAAWILRRLASRDGKGVSVVLQEALMQYAVSRGWQPVLDPDDEPDESLVEEARVALLDTPVEGRRLLLAVTELAPEERQLLGSMIRGRLGIRRAFGLACLLWLVVVVSALWRLGATWTH